MRNENSAKRTWIAPEVSELGDLKEATQGANIKYFGSSDGFTYQGQDIGDTPTGS